MLSANYMKTEEEMKSPDAIDNEFMKSQRLDEMGYSVGYR